MKGALLFYGEMRAYKKSVKHLFENLIEINDIDIFISTHKTDRDNISINKNELQTIYGNNLKDVFFAEDDTNINDFIKYFTNKLKLVDSKLYDEIYNILINIDHISDLQKYLNKLNKKFGSWYYINENSYQYVLRELFEVYHREKAYQMMLKYKEKNNIKYDYVIIYRPDLYFTNKLDIKNIILDDKIVYIRINFFILTTYTSIKKIIYDIYNNYYNLDEIENYIDKYICSNKHEFFLRWKYLSEMHHIAYLHNKNNFIKCYDIFDTLNHYRSMYQCKDIICSVKQTNNKDFINILNKTKESALQYKVI